MIYFITDGYHVKIGYTERLDNRVAELQTSNAFELKILRSVPGSLNDERKLHKRFKHLHIRGEWFQLNDELKSFIHGSELDDVEELHNIPHEPRRTKYLSRGMMEKLSKSLHEIKTAKKGWIVIRAHGKTFRMSKRDLIDRIQEFLDPMSEAWI